MCIRDRNFGARLRGPRVPFLGFADLVTHGVSDDCLVLAAVSNPESVVLDVGHSAFAICALQDVVVNGRDRDGLLPALLVQVSFVRHTGRGNLV